MNVAAYFCLALVIAFCIAYTLQWHGAAFLWADRLSVNGSFLPSGRTIRDAIISPDQTARISLLGMVILGFVVVGFLLFDWHIAIGGFVFQWLSSRFIARMVPPDSDFFRRRIEGDILRQLSKFEASGDILGAAEMRTLSAILDKLSDGS